MAAGTGLCAAPASTWVVAAAALGAGLLVAFAFVFLRGRHASLALTAVSAALIVLSSWMFHRGSWLALFFGLATIVAIAPRRLTFLCSLAALAPASAVGVFFASRQDALTSDDVPAAEVAHDGPRLAAVLAVLVVMSGALAWVARVVTARVPVSPRLRRSGAVVLAGVAVGAVVATLAALGGEGLGPAMPGAVVIVC